MSWSFRFEANGAEFGTVGMAALDEASTNGTIPAEQVEKGKDAMLAALDAAEQVVTSGVVGDVERTISCSLSGHANTDHAPEDGWANDCVTISLSQL